MALLASEERRMRDESFPFSDETGTVTVEVNGYLWLTNCAPSSGDCLMNPTGPSTAPTR
jgi:hypothetical protein